MDSAGSRLPAEGRREKGERGRGEDENRDGCWSQRGGWVLREGGESKGVGRG